MKNFLSQVANFFREDLPEVIGAYFDGYKLFLVHMSDRVNSAEIDVDDADVEHLAEKISHVCRQHGWSTSAIGFCLREGDALTYSTDYYSVPEKEIPAFVKSWATAHSGKDALFSFTKLGNEIWMESLPRTTADELIAAYEKFGMNLRGLSVMPADKLRKSRTFAEADFIADIVRNRKAPNLLAARSVWSFEKISAVAAAIISIALVICSAKLLTDYSDVETELDAAKQSVNELHDDIALKDNIDADIAELRRINALIAGQDISPKNFNLLLNLGKIAGGGVYLTKIRAEENFFELEGISVTPDAVKSYLSRVKSFVAQSARLERSTENDDGDIVFVIRAETSKPN